MEMKESALNSERISNSSMFEVDDYIKKENEIENAEENLASKINSYIIQQVYADKSPEAKAGRRRAMVRAIYGEFICTFIFFFTVFGVATHTSLNNWKSEYASFFSALNAGLQAVAVCYAFSNVSGAHFNPSISFALWLTGKLSNRKVVLYVAVQLLASVIAMAMVILIFNEDNNLIFDACVVEVPDKKYLGRVFATEFVLTFILTYVAFTVAFEDAENAKKENMSMKGIMQTRGLTIYATNPQSKTGFAPFVIGFTIFSLALIGGSSGGAFNQARMFGPAIISGRWDNFYLYVIGQFCGSGTAGLMVNNLHRFGIQHTNARALPGLERTKMALHTDEVSKSEPPISPLRLREV